MAASASASRCAWTSCGAPAEGPGARSAPEYACRGCARDHCAAAPASHAPAGDAGLGVAAALTGLETLAGYPLSSVAPEVSLGVIYLFGVLLVSTVWGFARRGHVDRERAGVQLLPHPARRSARDRRRAELGRARGLPRRRAAGQLRRRARPRALEALERRREADLAAEMARLLLRTDDLRGALPAASHRLAHALDLPSAGIELEAVPGDDRRVRRPRATRAPARRASCGARRPATPPTARRRAALLDARGVPG
jgi:hypothetical protein